MDGRLGLIAAGFAAQRGLLALPAVIAVVIVGAALGDQLAFLCDFRGCCDISRVFTASRPHGLLERYDVLCIGAFRFLYGLRIAGPFILGTSGVSLLRFSVVNLLCVSVWSLIVVIVLVGTGIVPGRKILRKTTPNGRGRGSF